MKLRSKLFYSYIAFVVIYAALILLPTPDPFTLARFHVSVTGLRLIDVTIILVLAAIWFVGFYGYAKLRDYATLIRGNKDGQQIARLTMGVFVLVLWLPVSSIISSAFNYLALKNLDLLPAAIITNRYIGLLFPFVGFIFIGMGANGLRQQLRKKPIYWTMNALVLFVLYLGIIYYRLAASTYQRDEVYHLSLWMLALTIAVPYTYMWFIGFRAAYDLYMYSQNVAGIVFRKGWNLVSLGLGWLIVTSVAFQYLTTLSARLNDLSIYWLLAIIYTLLAVLSVGFVLIALGAQKLRKIEVV